MKTFFWCCLLAACCSPLYGQIEVPVWSVETRTGPLDNSVLGLNGTAPDLVKTGLGELILSGDNQAGSGSQFTGAAIIQGGTLTVQDSRAVPYGLSVQVNSGTFAVAQTMVADTLTGTAKGVIRLNGIEQSLGIASGSFNGQITGQGGLVKYGTGTLTLNGAINDYAGSTYIQDGGRLIVAGGNAIGDASQVVIGPQGTLELQADETIASLSDDGLNRGGTVVLGASRLALSQGFGRFSGVISGSGGITVGEEETLLLVGTNTYTGDTVISDHGGLLVADSTNHDAINDSSAVTVDGWLSVDEGDEKIASLKGHGFVELHGTKLTVIGGNSGTFRIVDGELDNPEAFSGIIQSQAPNSSSEFQNGATLLNAWVSNYFDDSSVRVDRSLTKSSVIENRGKGTRGDFDQGRVEESTILNWGETSNVSFTNGSTAQNGVIRNVGGGSYAAFDNSIGNDISIRNEGEASWTALASGSAAIGGATISNIGIDSHASFNGSHAAGISIENQGTRSDALFTAGSTATNVTIVNSGEQSAVQFTSHSIASNGTIISNWGVNSNATFEGSNADGVSIVNLGAYSSTLFASGSTVANASTIKNQGWNSRTNFDNSNAEGISIINESGRSSVRFENYSTASNGTTITNSGLYTHADFDSSQTDGITVINAFECGVTFTNQSTSANGTTILNNGTNSYAAFDRSVADSVTILNGGDSSNTRFLTGSVVRNGTTISNGGTWSFTMFYDSDACQTTIDNIATAATVGFERSDAYTVSILNRAWQCGARFSSGSTATEGSSVNNDGLHSFVTFDSSIANGVSIVNQGYFSNAVFENGSAALDGSVIRNLGTSSHADFNRSGAEGGSISNEGEQSAVRFYNHSTASNGTVVHNSGLNSYAEFAGSAADCISIVNQGSESRVFFAGGSAAVNGTAITNLGPNSHADFNSSAADHVAIVNSGEQSSIQLSNGATVSNSIIENSGQNSYSNFSHSSVDSVSIINGGEGSSTRIGGSTVLNGTTIFNDGNGSLTWLLSADVQKATIVNTAGAAATTLFTGISTGTSGTTVNNGAGGLLDISNLGYQSLTIGRVFGDGDIEIGWRNLAVGSQNNPVDIIGGSIGGNYQGFGGSLIKEGTGVLILTGTSNIGGGVTVNEGALELNGVFSATEGFQVGTNGVLKGIGVVDGSLLNNGRVEPGNGPGTFTVEGDYVQTKEGTIQLEIYGTKKHDRLIVGGKATLNGTLEVVFLGKHASAFYGKQILFLRADEGIKGKFNRVVVTNSTKLRGRFVKPTSTRGGVQFAPGSLVAGASTDTDPWSVIVAPASYGLVAKTPNDAAVAAALDHWIGIGTGDIAVVTETLDAMEDERYAGAFAAIEPVVYGGAVNTQLMTGHALCRMLDQQMGTCRFDSRQDRNRSETEYWVQGSGIFSKGGLSLQPGEEFNSGNLLVGGSVSITPDFLVGLYGGFGEGWTSAGQHTIQDYDRSSYGGYFTYDTGCFYVQGVVGGGNVDFDIERPVEFGTISRRATSKPESSEFLGLVTVGCQLPLGSRGWYLEPQLSGQYCRAGFDDVVETGAETLSLRIRDAEADGLRTYLGGRIARSIELNQGAVLSPYLQAHWVHEYLQGNSFEASLNGGDGPGFTYRMNELAQDGVSAAAGVNLRSADGVDLYACYNIDWGQNEADHGVALGISKKF